MKNDIQQDIVPLPKGFILGHGKDIGFKCPHCRRPLRTMQNKATRKFFVSCIGWPECNYTAGYSVVPDEQEKLFHIN